jgi:TonB family protein
LYVEVDPDGKTTNIRVVRSLGHGLDEKAIEAVRKWKFRPGFKDGKAVTAAATIDVNFRLLDNPLAAGNSTALNQMVVCSFSIDELPPYPHRSTTSWPNPTIGDSVRNLRWPGLAHCRHALTLGAVLPRPPGKAQSAERT